MSCATKDGKGISMTVQEKPEDNTLLWVGNLDDQAEEPILYELFQQVGPIRSIKIPKAGSPHRGYCFIEFIHAASVSYTVMVMEGTHLYGKKLIFQPQPDSVHAKKLFTQLDS